MSLADGQAAYNSALSGTERVQQESSRRGVEGLQAQGKLMEQVGLRAP